MSFKKYGLDSMLFVIFYEFSLLAPPSPVDFPKSCQKVVFLWVGGGVGTNSVSCPALGHLGNPQVGGWCAVIQRWWREAREGFEAIAGPSGGNCSSDYEGDVFPPVGR